MQVALQFGCCNHTDPRGSFSSLALALFWDYRTVMTMHHDNSNIEGLVCPGLCNFPVGG